MTTVEPRLFSFQITRNNIKTVQTTLSWWVIVTCFPEKPSWCRNVLVFRGEGKIVQRFERSDWLDTALYKNYFFYVMIVFVGRWQWRTGLSDALGRARVRKWRRPASVSTFYSSSWGRETRVPRSTSNSGRLSRPCSPTSLCRLVPAVRSVHAWIHRYFLHISYIYIFMNDMIAFTSVLEFGFMNELIWMFVAII